MQTAIHPKWYENATVKCACGNTFTVGATVPAIEVEVCSACHPFYTGQMKYVDTAGRVDAFKAKQGQAAKKVLSKKAKRELKRSKRIKAQDAAPSSLSELRKSKNSKKKKSN